MRHQHLGRRGQRRVRRLLKWLTLIPAIRKAPPIALASRALTAPLRRAPVQVVLMLATPWRARIERQPWCELTIVMAHTSLIEKVARDPTSLRWIELRQR
jgi:hypothetical protein